MRRRSGLRACSLALLGGLCAPVATAAPTSPASVERSVLDLAPVGATSLTITRAPADDGRRDLYWAAWDEGPPGHWHTHLLLARRERGATVAVWRADRPDAYLPTLRAIPPWSFGTSVVMLLQFQYGAAWTRAELLGLDAGGMPVLLDSLEAPVISWVANRAGFVLQAFDPTGGHAPTRCLGWNPSAGRLVPAAC